MRAVVAGDLHLGAGADLALAPGERLAEQSAVLRQIVRTANELDAPLIWTGDAWERRRPTPEEILAFVEPLSELKGELIGILGNHDVEAWERPTGYDLTALASPRWTFASKPGVTIAGDGSAVYALLPWASPARLVATEGGGDRDELNRRLAEGLVDVARGLYLHARQKADAISPPPAVILVAHWSVGGSETPTGIPADLFREPVLNLADLEGIGFDAIALGHIHKAQTFGETGSTFYPGSPLPLNFGEARIPHGVMLLDVEPGRANVYAIPLESRRLVIVDLELRDDGSIGAISDDVVDAIVKVRIRGTAEAARRFDVARLKAELETGARKVWAIQVEVERAEVVRGVTIDETVDDVEAFRLWLEASAATRSPVDGDDLLEEALLERHARYLEEASA